MFELRRECNESSIQLECVADIVAHALRDDSVQGRRQLLFDRGESLRSVFCVSQAQCRYLEQNVRVVGTYCAVLHNFLHEMREDLTQSSSERHDILLAELNYSQKTSHSVEVLVVVEEFTDVLE